jgi:hypothetical protein
MAFFVSGRAGQDRWIVASAYSQGLTGYPPTFPPSAGMVSAICSSHLCWRNARKGISLLSEQYFHF